MKTPILRTCLIVLAAISVGSSFAWTTIGGGDDVDVASGKKIGLDGGTGKNYITSFPVGNTNEVALFSNNTQTLTAEGPYVGIGTTAPISTLTVSAPSKGAIPVIAAVNPNGQEFYFNPNMCQGCVNPLVQSGDQALIFSGGFSQGLGNFVLGNWNSGPVGIRIQNNGNIGIDTAFPQQKLDVAGNIRLTGNIVSPNDICIGAC